ncbi:hypothetical protein X011_07970 [Mycobacterium tuberculosis variant microti OV254]|nr:hypothetical protein X011_07970 [Mycobacterium tuberculosis variant microti OV254]
MEHADSNQHAIVVSCAGAALAKCDLVGVVLRAGSPEGDTALGGAE